MRRFKITGMSCAACAARVEKATSSVDGIRSCSVNLLTNSMTVEGDAPTEAIELAVKRAGYGIIAEGKNKSGTKDTAEAGGEIKQSLTRLIASAVFLAALMYFSMGRNMLSLPVGAFFDAGLPRAARPSGHRRSLCRGSA